MDTKSFRVALSLALTVACLSVAAGTARAQVPVRGGSSGIQRDLQPLGPTGQQGTVTLFESGSRTMVVVNVKDETPNRTEPALIARTEGCASPGEGGQIIPLNPVVAGWSRTVVDLPASRLLTGYSILVHAGDLIPAHFVSCAELAPPPG